MRRLISVICTLFSLLLVLLFVQAVSARPDRTTQDSGETFKVSPAIFTTHGKVNTLVSLSNGRMLVGGRLVSIGGRATPRGLAIINSDGTLDTSFQVDANLVVEEVYAAALQPDGKIVIAGVIDKPPDVWTHYVIRLNSNGSLDNTFNPYFNAPVYAILVDGTKIVIGGGFNTPTSYLTRLNQDGTVDSTFNGVGSGPDGTVRGIARQSNGKYIIVGSFSNFDGTSQTGVARLNTNGSLDTTFVPGGYRVSRRVAVLTDDSVLVGGEGVCGTDLFKWYAVNGAPKSTSGSDPNWFESITAFLPLSDCGFLIGGWYSSLCIGSSPTEHVGQVWRFSSNGAYRDYETYGDESDVYALALRSDGKVTLGGQGRPMYSTSVGLFDGLELLDLSNNVLEKVPSFRPVVGAEAEISSLSVYTDGKLLVAGNFSHANGSPRFGLARLLANGSLDTSFDPFSDFPSGWSNAALALPDGRAVAGLAGNQLFLVGLDGSLTSLSAFNNYDRVSVLALQDDGKVLVGSDFGSGLRRLEDDFSGVDGAFTVGDAYGNVYALAVQTDTKILVGGDFSKYNSTPVPGLVRLDNDGNIDGSFNPPVFTYTEYLSGTIYSVAPLTNTQVLVGGNFTYVDGQARPGLVRLNNDGSLDTSFNSPTGIDTVKSICVQDDGSIWVGGSQATYYRTPVVLHLSENGAIDPLFESDFLSVHDHGTVNAVLCGAEGLNWAGGRFSLIDGDPFYGLVRYLPLRSRVFLPLIRR